MSHPPSNAAAWAKLVISSKQFPAQAKLGAKMVGWYESYIDAWIADPR